MYTVTARNIYRIYTSTYNNAASAFAAYYWYRWDMAAEITAPDGRIIAVFNGSTEPDPMTEQEEESCKRQHYLYHWERERQAPHELIGFISTTTRTNDYTYADR